MHDGNFPIGSSDRLAVLRNLLFDCGGLVPGETVLIVEEPSGAGYYSPDLANQVAQGAQALGLDVMRRTEPVVETALPPSGDLARAMADSALTVFLARRGDQLRFAQRPPARRTIVCYALDEDTLFSPFGAVPHDAMVALRDRLDDAFRAAALVRLTCPLGTDFSGQVAKDAPKPSDTSVHRFPLLVHSPLLAKGFSGRVVQAGFLVGTGSRYYQPYGCRLDHPIGVNIMAGQITDLDGDAADVRRAKAHYADISSRYDLDHCAVHSWHAGIHPGCAFSDPASASLERWSGSAFGNPRLMHLHTCGETPPGEISLNVLDPTISLDGTKVWDQGRLHPDRIPGGAEILAACPELAAVFARPAQACGAGPKGLSFS